MTIREMDARDLEQLREIHEKFYKEEFEFPNFFKQFFCAFTVMSDGKIISAGGVRPIAEAVILTDKSFSVEDRRNALLKVLDISCYVAGGSGFTQLHAFVQDINWKRQLMKYDFKPCKGQALVFDF